jgi:TrmH family RNA methyltransferase
MRKLAGLEEASGTDLAAELPLPPPLQLEVSGGEQQQQAGQQGQQQGQQQAGQQQGQRQQGQQQQQQQQGQGQQVAAAPMSQLQRLLVLEGVQDPGNLGTLLRCATAFGWDGVWLLPGCCDPFNDKALRASRGAALRLPLVSGDWQQLERVATDNGLMLLAAEPEDPDQQQQQQQETGGGHKQQQQQQQVGLGRQQEQHSSKAAGAGWLQELRQQRIALVLGTEGQGLSQRALAACRPVSVPMTGDMESLNVGIAGGILMFLLSEGLQPMLGTLERLGSAAVTRRDCF